MKTQATTSKTPCVGKITVIVPATDEGRDLLLWWTRKKQALKKDGIAANEFLLDLLLTARKSQG